MRPHSRRMFLAGVAATTGVLAVPSITPAQAQQGTTLLRDRWRDMLTGASLIKPDEQVFVDAIASLDALVSGYRAQLVLSPTQVFADLPIEQNPNPTQTWNTYKRLNQLARAWFTPGSTYHGDAQVLAEVLDGLRINNAVVYHVGRVETVNWYEWQIGAPQALGDTMAIVDEHLSAEERERYSTAIEYFVPDPFYLHLVGQAPELSTGGNRVDLCRAAAVQGIVAGSGERIARARDGLHDAYQYVTNGEGFLADGSFLQHGDGGGGIPYNGGYGLALLGGVSGLTGLLAGSEWEITDPTIDNLFTMVDLGYLPLIHDGRMMDCVSGRYIARPPTRDHLQGHSAIQAVLGLVPAVDPQTRARWRGMCRGWLERDSYHPPYEGASIAATAKVYELLSDATVAPLPELEGHYSYNGMDRAVHRRDGWAVAIAMHSRWVKAMEANSGENLKGTYIANGMTYLYDGDGGQYSDDFWPTVDPLRLPGVTVDRTPIGSDIGWSVSTAVWAGGAVLDGRYGAVGQTIHERINPLAARKSWFCFDEYVAALGTVVESPSGNPVETVVENRHLYTAGANALRIDGVVQPGTQGWTGTFASARWAHVDGVGGYVFPGGQTVNALRHERTGSWRDINSAGDPAPITHRYLTLWVDHGVNPVDSNYAYLTVPGASALRTAELAADPGVQILAHTKDLHAVRQPSTGIVAANFWNPGTVAGITVEAPANTDVPTLVVDDRDPAFEIVGGTWQTGSGTGRWAGQERNHAIGDGSGVARFHVTVPVSGRYGVDAWWFAFRNRATDQPFVVRHAGGETEVRVGLRSLSSRWVPLGAFDFEHGEDYWIDVRDDANGIVVADAVRLAPMQHRGGCSVLVRDAARALEVAISDPTHLQAELQVTIKLRGHYRSWTADDTVDVTRLGRDVAFTVDTSERGSRSHHLTLHR